MDWEFQLVGDYIAIENLVQALNSKQQCRNNLPYFSDAEVLSVYFWGLKAGLRTIRSIHDFTSNMLREWFPHLPGYQQYDKRLNSMADLIETCFFVVSLSSESM